MILNNIKTIYASVLTGSASNKLPYKVLPNTTLNERFTINVKTGITPTIPDISYMVIGNGGTVTIDGDNTKRLINTHEAKDGALFSHIPFRTVPINNDIPTTERKLYRLRKQEQINGEEYYSYYMKKIVSSYEERILQINVDNGNTTLIPFDSNDTSILNPVPRIKSITDLENSKYLTVSYRRAITLSEIEIIGIKEAILLKYGENAVSAITEIGIASGIDEDIDGITEVGFSQIMFFIEPDNLFKDLFNTNTAIIKEIEFGGMEPLL